MAHKKESPEGKKEAPQGNEEKKFKSKAFPLGSPERKSETPKGNELPQEIRPGNEHVPSGNQRESSDSSEALKETNQIPSGEEEVEMPLDEEGKEFVREAVRVGIEPLEKKLGIVDKVQQAVETIKEKLATPPAAGTEPKETTLDEDRVVAKTTQRIREEQEEERKRRERDETSRKEREEQQRFRDWCLRNPEAAECKDMGEFIDKRTVAKIEEVIGKRKEEPEAEPSPGLSLPKKFEELTTEEQESIRKEIGEKVPHPILLGILEECNKGNDPDKCDLAGHVARVFPKETAHKLLEEGKKEVTTTVCKDGECKPIRMSLKEDGIAFWQKTEKGTWEPVDEELKKEVEEQFETRLKEELKKQKPLF